MELREALTGRRSIRRFSADRIDDAVIEDLVALACLAPAPHHTQPWRFVHLRSSEARERLSHYMGAAWREDLTRDGWPQDHIEHLLARSHERIVTAPTLLLGCLIGEGLRVWPDERRQRCEWMMAAQSMGGALQNLMLAAHDRGLASYWLSAPLFCPEAVQAALRLPPDYQPQALVALGRPAPDYVPRPRPPLSVERILLER